MVCSRDYRGDNRDIPIVQSHSALARSIGGFLFTFTLGQTYTTSLVPRTTLDPPGHSELQGPTCSMKCETRQAVNKIKFQELKCDKFEKFLSQHCGLPTDARHMSHPGVTQKGFPAAGAPEILASSTHDCGTACARASACVTCIRRPLFTQIITHPLREIA